MGYTAKTGGFKTVPLSAGYTATIRKLTKKQMDQAQAHLLIDARRHTETTPGEQARLISEARMDNGGYTTALLLAGIVEWTLDGPDDAPLGVTKDAIENVLTADDAALLVREIDALAAGLDPNAASAGPSGSS